MASHGQGISMARMSWAGAKAFLGLIALAICFIAGSGCKKKKPPPPAPPEVLVITVQPKDVPIYKEWIGTLDGLVNAQIRAQVTGYLLTQRYGEGKVVKKGDLLFE